MGLGAPPSSSRSLRPPAGSLEKRHTRDGKRHAKRASRGLSHRGNTHAPPHPQSLDTASACSSAPCGRADASQQHHRGGPLGGVGGAADGVPWPMHGGAASEPLQHRCSGKAGATEDSRSTCLAAGGVLGTGSGAAPSAGTLKKVGDGGRPARGGLRCCPSSGIAGSAQLIDVRSCEEPAEETDPLEANDQEGGTWTALSMVRSYVRPRLLSLAGGQPSLKATTSTPGSKTTRPACAWQGRLPKLSRLPASTNIEDTAELKLAIEGKLAKLATLPRWLLSAGTEDTCDAAEARGLRSPTHSATGSVLDCGRRNEGKLPKMPRPCRSGVVAANARTLRPSSLAGIQSPCLQLSCTSPSGLTPVTEHSTHRACVSL
mmetsp:Transcript_41111/g.127436  ORF Transcript_41111/g.127436 Transcript_41111/m.127436 type:complete len:374 (+) Transcript_41111:134-1255(+)